MVEVNPRQALYRQWRPQRFADILGQETLARTLQNAVRAGHVAHAYLFAGERGIGKTSAARILARAVNCLQPAEGEPCNACAHCLTILSNRTLDVVEIDGASNRGIDHIRQLREEVSFSPTDLRKKVYIIDEVHMLTQEAFNALLKTLEEPPSHIMFIFATTEPHKVPRTIISRCQAFDFRRIERERIAQHLAEVARSLAFVISEEALDLIARRANGGMRDALVMLEQVGSYGGNDITAETVLDVLGLAERSVHEAFLDAIEKADQATLIGIIDELVDRGKDLDTFLSDVVSLVQARLRGPSGRTTRAIWVAHGLLQVKADMFRSLDRRIRFEIGVLAMMDTLQSPGDKEQPPPARGVSQAARQGSQPDKQPSEEGKTDLLHGENGVEGPFEDSHASPAQPTRIEIPEACRRPWDGMLAEIQQDRIAIAAYLVEATPQLVEDKLVVSFHPEHAFHKESLEIRDNLTYLSGAARRHFGDRVHVVLRMDETVSRKPLPHEILMKKAQMVCDAVDGKILKEEM